MLQQTNGQEYRRVVEKYQQYLEERAKIKNKSNDKLSSAVRQIYLNPLLPSLQSEKDPATSRRKRQSSLFKEQYSHYKQESIDQISHNLQQSIVNPQYHSMKQKMSQQHLDSEVKQSFFIGLYKNQRVENQSRNITIKELVRYKRNPSCLQHIGHLPVVEQSPPPNEINLSRYFVRKSKVRKIDEISFTNKWERERGNNLIRVDKMTAEQLADGVIDYILSQDLMKHFFMSANILVIKEYVLELLKGVYYESILNFEAIIAYFNTLQVTYLEIFSIKYALAQTLIKQGYSFLFSERALNQFEEYRYLIQKPIPFVTKLFDNQYYQNVVKGLIMKLLRSVAYNKFLQNNKFTSEAFIFAVKNGLFPYLVGEYVALPLHARTKDVKAEMFRQQILSPYINRVFVIQVQSLLNEYNLENLYIKDVERRLLYPKNTQEIVTPDSNFPLYYVNAYVQCRNTLISSYDIKALLKIIKISQSDTENILIDENLKFLQQYDYMTDDMQLFQ